MTSVHLELPLIHNRNLGPAIAGCPPLHVKYDCRQGRRAVTAAQRENGLEMM